MYGPSRASIIAAAAIGLFGIQVYLNSPTDIVVEEPFADSSVVQMTRKEAKALDSFFREILIPDSLVYTLAGAKPLSFTCYQQPSYSPLSLMPSNLKIIRGWKVWEKYQHHFQNARILFWQEESPWVKGICCLILADRGQCDRCKEQNSTDFEKILGTQTKDLFKDIREKPFFQNTLQMHEALIGILLGFGKRNAWLYYENTLNNKRVNPPRIWNSVLEAESSHYAWKYCTFQNIDMFDLKLPQFVGDPDSEESKQLMQNYLMARENIKEYYKGRNFLSATLSLYKHGSIMLEQPREEGFRTISSKSAVWAGGHPK